ncbi:MAG: hypothetical protein MMC23_006303 [Stictis urceolatum]|nr:hypothetical protein [Stictis urceolata]
MARNSENHPMFGDDDVGFDEAAGQFAGGDDESNKSDIEMGAVGDEEHPVRHAPDTEASSFLQEGATNAGSKLPTTITKHYKQNVRRFKDYWNTKDTHFPKKQQAVITKTIRDSAEKMNLDPNTGAIPFDTIRTHKQSMMKALDQATKADDKTVEQTYLMQYAVHFGNLSTLLKQRKLPAEFAPPKEFARLYGSDFEPLNGKPEGERVEDTKARKGAKDRNRRRGGEPGASNIGSYADSDINSNAGPETDSSADSDSEDDSLDALGKNVSGIPDLSKSHTLVGFRGEINPTVLLREGDRSAPRYRLMRYSYYRRFGYKIKLDDGKQMLESRSAKYNMRDVARLKAVAWIDDFNSASSPLDSIHPESEERLAWTYVLIGWSDHSESWETRTELRRFLGAKVADRLIYKRAARQLAKYNQQNGLAKPEIDDFSTPSRIGDYPAPALSTTVGDIDERSQVSSKRSRKAGRKSGRSKVSFEPSPPTSGKAVSQEQFRALEAQLSQMNAMMQMLMKR